ncbi:MAG: FAD-dependent oxidoreductase, partial [Woeseiaceae bacterium]|nr:FAD-dependent oxidoreductase [Woeseiaceae bacterium]
MTANKRNLRRDLLKTMGASALAASVAGCASMPSSGAGFRRPHSRNPMYAPRINHENVIREVVGHRPYRPAGFVVRSEKLGEKVVVHNYGHGGSGITLCWGSSALAVRETLGME